MIPIAWGNRIARLCKFKGAPGGFAQQADLSRAAASGRTVSSLDLPVVKTHFIWGLHDSNKHERSRYWELAANCRKTSAIRSARSALTSAWSRRSLTTASSCK